MAITFTFANYVNLTFIHIYYKYFVRFYVRRLLSTSMYLMLTYMLHI